MTQEQEKLLALMQEAYIEAQKNDASVINIINLLKEKMELFTKHP
ncbi:hypothetical protein J2S13_001521 [Oikeobacillus pervagus]|uniref:Uncharacterized protein n=1 Tax=Oikeobacillus pervagus TaxID=1325931 RepID=A0AAJ1T1L8_9BACI|nr:hypothetical protein [Oikeobacillus pervagus]MDQ0215122.1 hypothetical protein [Oikeobacillus pervagus]